MSVGGGACFDAGFAHANPHMQQGMPYAVHGDAWNGAPVGMVFCAPPPAPRLNAARPRLDRHYQPYAHAWYPSYAPMHQAPMGHAPSAPGMYAGWHAPPAYPYAPQPVWGAPPSWGAHDAHAAYAAHAYAANVHAQMHQAHYGAAAPPYGPSAPADAFSHEAFPEEAAELTPEVLERPPTPPPEATAVPLAAFGAEAIWRASTALVGLGQQITRGDDEGRSMSMQRTTSSPESRVSTPSRSPDDSPSSSVCSSEPFSPSRAQVSSLSSLPSTPSLSCPTPECDGELNASLDALRLDEAQQGKQSTALHRLVRAMGQTSQTFPSLSNAPETSDKQKGAQRRPRTPNKHAALGNEVSPAFRHFAHQVLAQTLLTPTALILALYYVQLLPAAIGSDAETALGLLAQPASTTPFKLLTLGLMLANKFLDDNTFLNKTWHEVTGIPLAELNKMESYFLCRTQFHLSLSDAAWHQHLTRLNEAELSSEEERSDRTLLLETLEKLLAEARVA